MAVKSAPLHDIGKIGIPDSILLKPGRLTPEEFEVMKAHPLIGAQAITRAMERALAGSDEVLGNLADGAFAFMETAREIALGHHEKWDGSGYPAGLKGDEIPISARLMALADVFDALLSRRIYKPSMSFDEVSRIIVAERGRHFDPVIVDAFLALRPRFAEVARRLADAEPAASTAA
jgi:putative two-component system response regulator